MNEFQYSLLLADHYEVETSCNNENGSSVDRIVTLISSSDSGTDVEILFQTKDAKTPFVNYNFSDLSNSELQVIDWQLKFQPHENVPFMRHFKVPPSESTTHLAILFVLDMKKERLRDMQQEEQKVFYFYASGHMLDQLKKSLKEQLILRKRDELPLSPVLNIRRHPLSLLPQNQCQGVALLNDHRTQQMMDLHYHLALNDQYITETSCHFDGASEEAVQSVITYIDVGPSGGIVDIFFKKMNNQVSFAQYQLHHLNASEFGIIELNILYSKTTSEKKEDQPLNKQFNIPGTKYTSHLKMAVVFNLSSLCEEPKIVYILLKDSVKSLHEQSSINAEEMETFSSDVDDGVPKNSQSNSTKSSAPYIPANIDENEMYVAQSETHAAPSMSKEQLQSEPSNVQSNSDPKDHLSYNLLLQHLSETTPAAADFKSLRHDFKALGNALSETVRKFFNGDYLVDILNMCSSSSPDITVKTNSDVTVNLYQVHNNISCHFPKVTNAVIGDGTIHSTSVWNGCNSDMHE